MEAVRVAETWQRAAVYYLRINAFVKEEQIPIELEFDGHDTEDAKYILLLDGKEPVATARLYIVDENTAKIERVCVAEKLRSKGVGRNLIEAAENWAKELGVGKIIITSQAKAVGFYEKLGYIPNPEIKYDSFIPIVYTEKVL